MNPTKHDSRGRDNPTPDDLAGIPVCKEEDHPMIRIPQSNEKQNHNGTENLPRTSPTADELAGVPVSAEGAEDLTVRQRKPVNKK